MSGLQRSGKRDSKKTATKKTMETHDLEGAYIIPAETGDKIIQGLAELPIKYSQIVGPMIDGIQKAFRGNITITIDPNKEAPKSPPVEPSPNMEVKKPEKK